MFCILIIGDVMISVTLLSIKDDIEKIKELDNQNVDYLHIDVMDGKFVNNKVDLLSLPPLKNKVEVHLMVNNVKEYVDMYKKYQPEWITFHIEATDDVIGNINYIKEQNMKVGLAISPDTSIQKLLPYLDKVDVVLVMSVVPGKGGQAFIETSPNKIQELVRLREEYGYNYLIEVDGGINDKTKDKCVGADILAVGSYVTLSDNYAETIGKILG